MADPDGPTQLITFHIPYSIKSNLGVAILQAPSFFNSFGPWLLVLKLEPFLGPSYCPDRIPVDSTQRGDRVLPSLTMTLATVKPLFTDFAPEIFIS